MRLFLCFQSSTLLVQDFLINIVASKAAFYVFWCFRYRKAAKGGTSQFPRKAAANSIHSLYHFIEPNNRDYPKRALAWMDKYVKKEPAITEMVNTKADNK